MADHNLPQTRRKSTTHKSILIKKGNACHFGYKSYVGVDRKTRLVHMVKVTAANVPDVTIMPDLLIGEETFVYEDS